MFCLFVRLKIMKKYCLVMVLFVAGMERMVFSSLDLSPLFPYSNFHNQEESGRDSDHHHHGNAI